MRDLLSLPLCEKALVCFEFAQFNRSRVLLSRQHIVEYGYEMAKAAKQNKDMENRVIEF